MSARKSSHGTIFLIVSNGSPLALIASSLRSTSKKPVCPMTRSLHPPMAHCRQRVRFAATWREKFFEVPYRPPQPRIKLEQKSHHNGRNKERTEQGVELYLHIPRRLFELMFLYIPDPHVPLPR